MTSLTRIRKFQNETEADVDLEGISTENATGNMGIIVSPFANRCSLRDTR